MKMSRACPTCAGIVPPSQPDSIYGSLPLYIKCICEQNIDYLLYNMENMNNELGTYVLDLYKQGLIDRSNILDRLMRFLRKVYNAKINFFLQTTLLFEEYWDKLICGCPIEKDINLICQIFNQIQISNSEELLMEVKKHYDLIQRLITYQCQQRVTSEQKCYICDQEFKTAFVCNTPCQHQFHSKCLYCLLSINQPQCPQCDKEL